MVVPSGKKVELVELVMEADCSEVKDLPDVVLGDEQEGDKVHQEGEKDHQEAGDRDDKLEHYQEGEGEKVPEGALGLSIEGQGAHQIAERESHHDLKDSLTSQHCEAVVTHVSPTHEVPLLHEVLRIPSGQSVPLAQPEEEGEELLGENDALPVQAVVDPQVPDEVVLASKEPPDAGKTDSTGDTAHLTEPKSTNCDNFEAATEVINNLEEGEEEEEDLILSGNFVDTISEKSREEDAASFLPPLTMNTPLKRWEVPRPLVTSTPAAAAGESRLSLPPTSSSPLPPPSPDGPLSLPGLVSPGGPKSYDYLLKVLLVGDSDVGKQEILGGLEDGAVEAPYASSTGAAFKTTTILIDGKRVKLQLWDTSGQGRFCTIIRSYSRGAQGILLVYDITNKWSFEGMDRWVKEVEEHAPGIPKVLVGNRLHLAFNRQVEQEDAERYAERHHMGFYEVSPLVNFNITESFQELCRMALRRNGMERLWRGRQVTSLHELCCHAIVGNTANVYGIDKLPLPDSIKANLKSYALTNATNTTVRPNYKSLKEAKRKKEKTRPGDAVAAKCVSVSRKSCVLS